MISRKSKKKRKGNFLIKVFLIINIIFAVFLILSYFAAYISPEKIWWMAFFGMAFPYLYLVNLLFVSFWLIFRRKYALILGLIMVAGLWNVFKIVQSSRKYSEEQLKDSFKVITYNVRNFDIYNTDKHWNHNFTLKNKIFRFLAKEQPDILCFQEYVNDVTGRFKTHDTLKEFLKAKNSHLAFTVNSRNQNYFGIATYTTFPVIDTGRVVFSTIAGNICMYTDVKINTDTVRIYNVHLESVRMESEDYVFAESVVKTMAKNKNLKRNSERIFGRVKKAFILRAPEAELVAEHIKQCPYPIILCGDFNDTPTSYAYHVISSELDDAFVEAGNGIGQSYAGVFPLLRIDYIMHSKEFKAYNFETIEEKMSDHYPVKCFLEYKKEE